MKTNIICKFGQYYPHLRVKLNKDKFPYVIIDHEQYILGSHLDRAVPNTGYDDILEILEGRDELESILKNPELTVDKLTSHQLIRMI